MGHQLAIGLLEFGNECVVLEFDRIKLLNPSSLPLSASDTLMMLLQPRSQNTQPVGGEKT